MSESLKIKKLVPEAVLPSRANDTDAGYDCVAIDDGTWSDDQTFIEYRTGISIELPPGMHSELFPRSSVSKYDLVLANSIGLVDNGYRGEVRFRFKYVPRLVKVGMDSFVVKPAIRYKKGDKIGQIVIRNTVSLPVQEVEDLSETVRGEGGFGSSGR